MPPSDNQIAPPAAACPRIRLTLDHLQVFVDAAAAGSFSHTARRMHRAQSAVTYAVQKMEQQLGT